MDRSIHLVPPLALALLAGLAAPVGAQSPGPAPEPSPEAAPGPSPGAAIPAVEPVRRWTRFERVAWTGAPLDVHLRTGHARPLILPEPVEPEAREPLPGCDVEVDREVVLFEPARHFGPEELTLVGVETRTRYRLRVRSSAYGQRVPLEVVATP